MVLMSTIKMIRHSDLSDINILLNYAVASQADGSINAGDVDRNKSGKFLVYRTRHMFSEGNYNVKMDIVKLTDKTGDT